MTCSLDGTVKFFNVEKNKAERTYPTKTKVATKETTLAPVHSLVYVRASKCMASCGVTRHITTWNPHTCDTMSVLHGHTSPVVALDVDEAGGRLISLSLDKCIKFWDVSSWRCLQSTVDDSNYRPDNYITAMMWDPVMQTLVTAGNRIKVWHHIGRESGEETTSHETPVCAALYNNKFQQVVSCSPENVQVWSIESGQLVFKFDKLHGDEKITTMSFDWSMRRLITGAHDGSVRMWNFSNGMMLKEFLREEGDDDDDEDGDNDDQDKVSTIKSLEKTLSHDNDTEVTSVKYILEQGGGDDIEHKFIVSVGWDKRVRMFVDDDDDIVNPHRILPAPGFSGHNDDILCVVHCEPRLLATGSYDGEIVVWSLASGAGRFFLRLSDYEEFHEDPKEEVGKGGEEVDKVGGELKAFQHLTVDTKLYNGRPSHLHGYSKRDEVTHTELLAAREAHKEKQRIRAEEELLMGAELGSKKGSPKKGTPANSPSRMAQTGGGTPSSQGQHTPTPTKPKEGHASHHGKFGADHRKIIEDKKLQHVLENPKLDPVMYNETIERVKKGMKHHHHTSAVVDEEEQGGGEEKKTDDDKALKDERGKLAVECLLFLKQKRIGEVLGQTLVSTGADGKIRFWSVKDGSLCHVMKACHPEDASITRMTTDEENNKYLFTGCAMGYVKVWTLKSLEKAATHRLHRRFSVFGNKTDVHNTEAHRQWAHASVNNTAAEKRAHGLGRRPTARDFTAASPLGAKGADFDAPRRSSVGGAPTAAAAATAMGAGKRRASMVEADYVMPKVYEIAGWKAHTGAIVSLEHVGEYGGRELLLTASTDCNVSMWTLKGAHIGIFGQVSTWSLTNPLHWMDKKEHPVEKPRGSNHTGGYSEGEKGKGKGGVLDEGGEGGGGGKGRRRAVGDREKNKNKKKKKQVGLSVADMMLPKNNFVRSSILKGMYDDSDSSSESEGSDGEIEHDPLKTEKKILEKKKKKLLAKYDRMISRSEGRLENYHYELAKAKLAKKHIIFEAARKGGKGLESPIVKEAMWNSRWGVGLRSNIPEADHNAGTKSTVLVKDNGMHEVMIRQSTGVGDEETLKTPIPPTSPVRSHQPGQSGNLKQSLDRIKILRSNYNQVAHQLGIHCIDSVEDCKGAERVEKRRKGD